MSNQVNSIVWRFAAGDPTATDKVRARVRRIVAFRGYGIPREDRVDLEQSVMLQLYEGVTRPDFETAGFWGFVEVVTSRRCIDWFRTRKPAESLEFPTLVADPGPGPLAKVLGKERERLAQWALAQLSPDCRELIDLHYRRRLPYSEIAVMLGKSEGSLRVRMHRCIQRASRALLEVSNRGSSEKNEPDQ